jgi:hypothetical protein
MTGVRNDVILSNAPNAAHEWQESMIVLGPGQRPEDLLEYGAVTIANLKEEHKTYSWEHELPPETSEDFDQGIIQVINTKSEYKPFSVIRPQDFEYMDFYAGEIRRDVSVFPWWNHWPVAPRPTDGRYAMAADRAAHSSLSHWFWGAYKTTDRSISKIMLNGMTNKNAEELVSLTKSWSNPAEIVVEQGTSAVYDPAQLAFVITVDDAPKTLNVTIKGTGDSPVYNPAFVVNGWGDKDLKSLKVNGKELKPGKDVKVGYRESMDSRDLIVWIKMEANTEQSFIFNR